mmetsp:Transcript_19722/g.27355  ORF Transcript_19722/g.27355 Transcript_19722/m.27355 type:complete len:358 (-) Transcript_19722:307-1380(-)
MEGQYTFQSAPRAVRNTNRKKYRDDDMGESGAGNIMFDPRVIRGNTYAMPVPVRQMQMTQKMGRNTRKKRVSKPIPRSSTPEPVPGRKHTEAQTDNFLEELHDKPYEAEISTQTDHLLDYPTAPLFKPKPSGVSKATEILPGDLFDFDLEVEPILEVLIGKSLDHALMEVLEEEELKELKQHKADFEQKRNTRLAEVQRLEAAEKRRVEEKERRIKQGKDFEEKQKAAAEKAKARLLAKQLLAGAEDVVFVNLEKEGKIEEPIRKQVVEGFLPWIMEQTRSRLQNSTAARQTITALMKDAFVKINEEVKQQEEADRIAAEQEAKRLAEEKLAREKAEAEAKAKAEAEAKAKAEEEEG